MAASAAPAGTLPQWKRRPRRRCGRAGLFAVVVSAVAVAGRSSVPAFTSGGALPVSHRKPFRVQLGQRALGLSVEVDTSVAEEVDGDAALRAHLLDPGGASAAWAERSGAKQATTGGDNATAGRGADAALVPAAAEVEEEAPLYEKPQRIGQRIKAFVEDISLETGTAQLHIGQERLAEIDIDELGDDDYLEPCQIREVYVKDFDKNGNAAISVKPVRSNRTQSSALFTGDRLAGKIKGFNIFGDVFIDIGADRHAWLAVDRRSWDDDLQEGLDLPKVYVRQQNDNGIWLDLAWPGDLLRPVASLRVGEKLQGVVAKYDNETRVAFVHVGAVRRGLLLRSDRTIGARNRLKVGRKLEVYVKGKLPDDSDFALTMHTPKLTLEQLRPGQQYQGSVQNLTNGGAFIDIGAERNGLLPRGELDGPHGDLVGLGKNVTVWVVQVREEKDFQLTLEKPNFGYGDLPLGSNLTGVVVGVGDKGVFVDVGGVTDGFVSSQFIPAGMEPRVGDKVETWVSAWRDRPQLHLTMIRPRVLPEELRRGEQIRGKVVGFDRDGSAFVDYGGTADAMLPRKLARREELEVGQEVDARFIRVTDRGRVVLGLQGDRREALPENTPSDRWPN